MMWCYTMYGLLLVLTVCFQASSAVSSTTPSTAVDVPVSRHAKVCYFTNWAIYRTGTSGKFSADNINFSYCNFILYAFVSLDTEKVTLKLSDPFADLEDDGGYGLIKKVTTRAKAEGSIVLASLGGWGDSNKTAYPRLFTDDNLQDAFVKDSVTFLTQHGFQGLDLDYEYPQCPQGVCNPGEAEKLGFSKLVVKLRTEYKKHGFYLTAAVSGGVASIDKYYEPKILAENLDWIGLMTYDYHGSSEKTVGLTAPFIQYGNEPATLNVKASVDAWISKGVPSTKLLLGVPFYGASYKLADKSKFTIGSPADGVGFKNRSLFYNEICELTTKEKWTVVHEENGKAIGGTYAYKDDQWVGYDDVIDVKAKGQYIREKQLQGYMVWALDEDDFNGVCGTKYPLLSALSNSLDGK